MRTDCPERGRFALSKVKEIAVAPTVAAVLGVAETAPTHNLLNRSHLHLEPAPRNSPRETAEQGIVGSSLFSVPVPDNLERTAIPRGVSHVG